MTGTSLNRPPKISGAKRSMNAQMGYANKAEREGRASPGLKLKRFSWEAVDECGQTG